MATTVRPGLLRIWRSAKATFFDKRGQHYAHIKAHVVFHSLGIRGIENGGYVASGLLVSEKVCSFTDILWPRELGCPDRVLRAYPVAVGQRRDVRYGC